MRMVSILLTWVFCALPLRAEIPDCRGDGVRCVELVAASNGGPQVMRPWSTQIDLSDFGETHDVFLSTRSEQALRCGEGHATLFLRCLDDRTSLFIWHGCALPTDQQVYQVEYSIDGGDALSADWRAGGDPATLGLWTYHDARRMIESMFDANRIALRWEDALGLRREVAFRITGLRGALIPLRLSCGWSDDWPHTG